MLFQIENQMFMALLKQEKWYMIDHDKIKVLLSVFPKLITSAENYQMHEIPVYMKIKEIPSSSF